MFGWTPAEYDTAPALFGDWALRLESLKAEMNQQARDDG